MKKILFHYFSAVLLVTAISCSKNNNDTNPDNSGKYANGFFVLTLGGDTATRNVGFYSYDKDSLFLSAFKQENPGHTFGGVGAPLVYSTIYGNRLYILARDQGYLVAANPLTLKETGRIRNTAKLDPHAFLGVSSNEGLLSTSDGIYRVSLFKPELGARINGINGFVGEMVKAGNYIFAFTVNDGIVVLKKQDYSIVKKIRPANGGFIISKDSSVWGMGGPTWFRSNYLLRINPATLHVDTIPTPFNIAFPVATLLTETKSCMAASTRENVIYLTDGLAVYRYVIGDPASLHVPIFTTVNNERLTGDVVNYDPIKNQLIILVVDYSSVTEFKNKIYFCDATTGAIQKTVEFMGYAGPCMAVFH